MIGAGGTAGHVVPALAVADALRAEGAEVVFVGGERAELELVPGRRLRAAHAAVAPLPRRRPVKAARAVAVDAGAVREARRAASSRSGPVPCWGPAATWPGPSAWRLCLARRRSC